MHTVYQPPAPAPMVIHAVPPATAGAVPQIPGVTARPGLAYLALAAMSKPPAPKAPAHKTTVYTVAPGDNLWDLAIRFYGNGNDFMRIFDANRQVINIPGLIKPGMQLVIPGASTSAAPAPPAPASPAPSAPASSPLPALPPAAPEVPWSIFQQPNGQYAAVAFAASLLKALGAPVTPGNLKVIYDWELSEGSGGTFNPLNGGDFAGLAISGTQYGGGANDYPSLAVNVRAMAGILINDTQYGYGAVVSALRANNPAAARQAIWASQWAASHYGYGASWSGAPLPG